MEKKFRTDWPDDAAEIIFEMEAKRLVRFVPSVGDQLVIEPTPKLVAMIRLGPDEMPPLLRKFRRVFLKQLDRGEEFSSH